MEASVHRVGGLLVNMAKGFESVKDRGLCREKSQYGSPRELRGEGRLVRRIAPVFVHRILGSGYLWMCM